MSHRLPTPAVFALLLVLSPVTVAAQDDLGAAISLQNTFTRVIEEAEGSVVSISRAKVRSANEPQIEQFDRRMPDRLEDQIKSPDFIPNAFGTGIVVDKNGLILTAYHVVRGGPIDQSTEAPSQLLYVRLADRRGFNARIYAADPRSDLAVLKIDATDLKPMKFDGPAEPPKRGQFVIGLGNPYAIARDGTASASWGIIANVGRRDDTADKELDDFEQGKRQTIHHLGTLLQLDMRLDLGTSGAPVLNLRGELVGMTTSLAAIAGYEKSAGFAIPFDNRMKRIIEALISGQEVEYGFLGISMPSNVTVEMLERVRAVVPVDGAARFRDVVGNSPAKDRLEREDLLLFIRRKGEAVSERRPIRGQSDVMREVGLLPPGETVVFDIWRNNQLQTVDVQLGKWPVLDDEGIVATRRPPGWRGLRVDHATARNRYMPERDLNFNRRVLDDRSVPPIPAGVLVTEVDAQSAAGQTEIRPGDLIERVNRQPVSNLRQFQELIKGLDPAMPVTLSLSNDRTIQLPAEP